jgi:uncharacterized peroxidase-related enzyme
VRDEDLVRSVSQNPQSANLSDRQRALMDFAIRLTGTPQAVEGADIERLRQQGFGDRAIHDLAAIIAYFNLVNRIASGLGVELESDLGTEGSKNGS